MAGRTVIAALVFCLGLASGQAQAADDHVACVQGQLAALGLDPGPVDGLNGPRTRTALAAYVEGLENARTRAVLDTLPAFSDRAAVGWCREIGLHDPVAAALMPSARPPAMFVGPGVHPEMESHAMTAFREAEEFLYRRYGVQVASQVSIILATDAEGWHAEVAKSGTMEFRGWADIRARARRDCDTEFGLGASASRNGLSFCGSNLALREPALAGFYKMVLSVTMAHELVHNAQREFSYDKVARWTTGKDKLRPRMGPAWMVEGTAQVVEQAFMQDRFGTLVPDLDLRRQQAVASDLTLEQIRTSGEVRTAEAYDASAYAVAMLVERYGEESLFRFWRAVGETDDWFAAFRQVYGMSVEDYEALYVSMRNDEDAEREFLSGRDRKADNILSHRPLGQTEAGQ